MIVLTGRKAACLWPKEQTMKNAVLDTIGHHERNQISPRYRCQRQPSVLLSVMTLVTPVF